MTMKQLMRQSVLLIAVVTLLVGAASCSRQGSTGKPSNVDYYTCTMHPSVREKEPGKCPICSMDLVPVMKGDVTTITQQC
jgi:Cu(I)/Ag(I) efflux system membrane fusion protein